MRRAGVVTHQQPVEPIHHLPERFVVREVPDDHRIAEERALHPAALDREVDDPSDQHLTRARVGSGSASAASIAVSTRASSASAAASTISSFVLNWW